MTTETEITNESLSEAIEMKREEVKERFELDDEQFNLLIRNVILDSFDKLRIRLSEDDPIFAVILAQKSVMDYYALMITNSLNNLPKQIGNAVDSRLEKVGETINVIGEAFDNELLEFKQSLKHQTLDLNNQIIASFSTFIEEKIKEIKYALKGSESLDKPQAKSTGKSILSPLILVFTLLNIVIAGLTLYSLHNGNTKKETAYQMGLFRGFEQVRKVLPAKEADKAQTIVIEAIDKELKAK